MDVRAPVVRRAVGVRVRDHVDLSPGRDDRRVRAQIRREPRGDRSAILVAVNATDEQNVPRSRAERLEHDGSALDRTPYCARRRLRWRGARGGRPARIWRAARNRRRARERSCACSQRPRHHHRASRHRNEDRKQRTGRARRTPRSPRRHGFRCHRSPLSPAFSVHTTNVGIAREHGSRLHWSAIDALPRRGMDFA